MRMNSSPCSLPVSGVGRFPQRGWSIERDEKANAKGMGCKRECHDFRGSPRARRSSKPIAYTVPRSPLAIHRPSPQTSNPIPSDELGQALPTPGREKQNDAIIPWTRLTRIVTTHRRSATLSWSH